MGRYGSNSKYPNGECLGLLIISSILLLNGSCEKISDRDYIIRVRNNSEQTVSVFAGYLPDTLLPEIKPNLKDISSGKSKEIYDKEVGDEKFERLKTERITVFILDSDTVKTYSWDEVRENYNILKRYTFNNQELNEMGGSVNYP